MYIDYTNAFGPRRPCLASEQAESKLKKNPAVVANTMAIFERADQLVEAYGNILEQKDVSKAQALCWGRESVEAYERAFFVNVLTGYRIWEVKESYLKKLRNAIKKNNPEWLSRFEKDLEDKRKRLKKK